MRHHHTSFTSPENARQASLLPFRLSIHCCLCWTEASLQYECWSAPFELLSIKASDLCIPRPQRREKLTLDLRLAHENWASLPCVLTIPRRLPSVSRELRPFPTN